MVTGRVKFYDAEKGFGYLSQDSGGADVYVGKAALHAGLDGLARGKRVEFEVSQGQHGPLAHSVRPLARSVRPLDTGPEPAPRRTAAELDVLIKDMIGLLDAAVLPELRQGRYPEWSSSQRVAEMARAIVRNLDIAATATQRPTPRGQTRTAGLSRAGAPGRRGGLRLPGNRVAGSLRQVTASP